MIFTHSQDAHATEGRAEFLNIKFVYKDTNRGICTCQWKSVFYNSVYDTAM